MLTNLGRHCRTTFAVGACLVLTDTQARAERDFLDMATESYERYIASFPSGVFTPIAHGRVQKLENGESLDTPLPPTAFTPPVTPVPPPAASSAAARLNVNPSGKYFCGLRPNGMDYAAHIRININETARTATVDLGENEVFTSPIRITEHQDQGHNTFRVARWETGTVQEGRFKFDLHLDADDPKKWIGGYSYIKANLGSSHGDMDCIVDD
jgi:hypothetical protein